LAKRAGIRSGQKLLKEEMQALIDGLFACSTSNYSPDGLPTFFIFELRKIESYFNRQ
jgi:DNA mismatch repair protein MutL